MFAGGGGGGGGASGKGISRQNLPINKQLGPAPPGPKKKIHLDLSLACVPVCELLRGIKP